MQRVWLITVITSILIGCFEITLYAFEFDEKEKIIFETDMGNDIDDALALDMLFKYVDLERVELLGIIINKSNTYSAEFIDIMATWHGYNGIPMGIVKNGIDQENDAVNYAEIISEMKDNGVPVFERSQNNYTSLPEAAKLYREILSQQPDRSVTIVSVGFFTNLAQLLQTKADEYSSLDGIDLVAKKVKFLTVMAGSFGENSIASYNIVKDIPSARKVFSTWPTNIVASPAEVGIKIKYPASSIMNDFKWAIRHPLVEAYKVYLPMPYDRPTWDLTNLLYVMERRGKYFDKSGLGTIIVDRNGFTQFQKSRKGKHSYLLVEEKMISVIQQFFVDLITRKPKKYIQIDIKSKT